jgi:hypothetical protein
MRRSAHGLLIAATAALLCGLAGCGAGGDTPEAPGAGSPERPCPSATPSGGPTATEPHTGAPGDSRDHTPDPSGNCVIESGAPAMPEDP